MKADQIARFNELDNALAKERRVLGMIDKGAYRLDGGDAAHAGSGNYGARWNSSNQVILDPDLAKIIRPIHRAMTLERIAAIEAEQRELDR